MVIDGHAVRWREDKLWGGVGLRLKMHRDRYTRPDFVRVNIRILKTYALYLSSSEIERETEKSDS